MSRPRRALTVAEPPLAAGAALHLDVAAGPERAVAATKSSTNQLLALQLLVDPQQPAEPLTPVLEILRCRSSPARSPSPAGTTPTRHGG